MAVYQWREVLTSNAYKAVGKFRIELDEDNVEDVWTQIGEGIASGILGVCAKLTARPVESSGRFVAYVFFAVGQREQCRIMLKAFKIAQGPHYFPT